MAKGDGGQGDREAGRHGDLRVVHTVSMTAVRFVFFVRHQLSLFNTRSTDHSNLPFTLVLPSPRLPFPVSFLRLHLNITNFLRLQTFHELHHFIVVVPGIVGFDHQEKVSRVASLKFGALKTG